MDSYIEVIICKLTKLEKLVSGLPEYKNLNFAKLNHLKMLKTHTYFQGFVRFNPRIGSSSLTEFPIAKNLQKFNFEFREDKLT